MKYCLKCGKDMFDEAVICPKCGCPVESATSNADKLIKANKRSKFAAATILNIIAFVISLVLCITTVVIGLNYTKPEPPAGITVTKDILTGIWYDGSSEAEKEYAEEMKDYNIRIRNTKILAVIWPVLAISLLIVGRKAKKKSLVYVYMLIAIVMQLTIYFLYPDLIVLLVCGFGFIWLVPLILEIIASVKFFQATNENE